MKTLINARYVVGYQNGGQAVIEFQEITRRHGLTPIEFLHDVGLLTRRLIIGHCISFPGIRT